MSSVNHGYGRNPPSKRDKVQEAFSELTSLIRHVNDLNGWKPTEEELKSKWYVPGVLALIHSEVSECLEGYRNGDDENVKEELADILIRTFDLISNLKIQGMAGIVLDKIEKNRKRGYKHDGKCV